MGRRLSRRTLLADTAAGAAAALTRFSGPAVAQAAPFKLGLLTVKTGPLAAGIQMEQGALTYLKEKNYTLGGRKVDFISGDTGGNPAGAKTKAQELIQREKVDAIVGPLAAFELYAINDYIIQQKNGDAEPGSGRQPHPAHAESLSVARLGNVLASDPAAWPLCGDVL
jgi:branched-chain amino acid transport system substrate-binding protein